MTVVLEGGGGEGAELVSRCEALLICRLCYSQCGDTAELRRHEAEQHKQDLQELQRTEIRLADLQHACSLCLLQFLTENLLQQHRRTEHKMIRGKVPVPYHSLSYGLAGMT